MKFILKHLGKIIEEVSLEEGREYLIGRHKDCDFVLQEEAGLSRNHVKIYQSTETGHWIIESISEMGGLYLEGEEVEGVELEGSSLLTLKSYVFEFIKEEDQKEEEEDQKTEENFMPELPPAVESKKEVSLSGSTKILNDSDLIHSLHVYISGEFSDDIGLDEGESWIVGRSEECDISIDYSVLTRKHLQISKVDGYFYVKDMGSSNKTFLNGKELEPQKTVPLRANDEISISDLRIIFEVRNKNLEQVMSNLPSLVSEDSEEEGGLPAMALSKVVLEEAPPEAEEADDKKQGFLTPKKLIILIGIIALGVGLYFNYESEKKKKKALAARQKIKEQQDKLEVFYRNALNNKEEERYQLCIEQIEELHRMSSGGYFKDSEQILIQCQNALDRLKQKEEYLEQEKIRKQTEARIQEIVDRCKKQYSKKVIQTVEDLNKCAEELLGGLDPANSEISSIRMEIEEKERLELLALQKREAYQALIRGKRGLYSRAKKRRDKSDISEAPEVIKVYNVFLKAAKGFSPLQELYKQAEEERDSLQNEYDTKLTGLYKSCENLINNNKLKQAYYNCREILNFRKNDKKAREYMKTAKLDLQKEFKSIYEQSMLDESFSRIKEAKKLWTEILEKDIKEGYYYKKALVQIKKYK